MGYDVTFESIALPPRCACVRPEDWIPGPGKSFHICQRTRKSDPNATKKMRSAAPIGFVAVDGEGVTFPDGTHRYVMLACGKRQIVNPDGFQWHEVLDFLYSCFRPNAKISYIGFFLGYDFTQWLASMPEDRAAMAVTIRGIAARARTKSGNNHTPYPVGITAPKGQRWEFDILGTKRFKFRPGITRAEANSGVKNHNQWMSICDTGPFFQKSFISVIDPENWSEPVCTAEEHAKIIKGKGRRGGSALTKDDAEYNLLENDILPRVVGRLRDGFAALGIDLKGDQWFGPGQAAQAWMGKGRAITNALLQEVTPAWALEACLSSYFGGRFEIMAHGLVPGVSWEYDICSAYPYIISGLPCLEHGEWSNGAGEAPAGRYVWMRAEVRGSDPYMGGLPHRDDDGSIMHPQRTSGWYWKPEVDAAVAAGLVNTVTVKEWWKYEPCDCPPPLREVRDIYDLRLKVGKKTPLGIACKLMPNALYGKFAQSIGNPKYGNPVYASLITGGCREMILLAVATHPNRSRDVLMIATDGIYFRTRHPNLDMGTGLGQWEEKSKSNLMLFKPGVYWDDTTRALIAEEKTPVFKARGVNARDFGQCLTDIDGQFAALAQAGRVPKSADWPKVTFPVGMTLVTPRQALNRGDWKTCGNIYADLPATQQSNPALKRQDWFWSGDVLRSKAKTGDRGASCRYEKRMGLDDPYSDQSREEFGITPDGIPGDFVREALGQ